ncbi:MAG: polysaccharide biosynthesis/export family protein [Bacteroidales bacterium]|jgi:polysaccharide export outer membrane protein|nr:polysaccharide biosynthesis/export family protein [Bacteroidales bacterium]MCI2122292.1 polysaccharide biosynthesis/export family protein [Bacteroidales bacterium]MCI2145747.1 polysaccharide biosynthesis/export family protein [Bacteroidales bacterium]
MNKFAKILFTASASCLVLAFAGCGSSREISYLQNLPPNYIQEIPKAYEIHIHTDDMLSVQVNSKDQELAQMFNLPVVGYQMNQASSSVTASTFRSNYQYLGYLVDKDGNIDFPQLGEIKVEGMTRNELADYLKNRLITGGYVNDPIVTVQFLNFKVSVIGEVNRPGTFNVTSDRITIFEALSQAGDMTIYGRRNNVKVLREEDGKRTIATVDLRGKDILNSPYYYLQQNDIVYVEPNNARAGQSEINQNRTVSTWVSATSMLVSLATLIISIVK